MTIFKVLLSEYPLLLWQHILELSCRVRDQNYFPQNCKGTIAFLFKIWATPSEFGTYRLCEQRRFRRACASAQSRQNLRCSLIQAVNQEESSDRKPDPWPLWMAGHARLKFVMTECSKTQIRLAGPISFIPSSFDVFTGTVRELIDYTSYSLWINRIHHLCSVGTEKSGPEGPPFQ